MPTEEPVFFVPQKFVKRPYYRLVYFTRLSSSFYIQEPIPHTERTKVDDLMVRWDSNPQTLGISPERFTIKLLTKHFGKTDGYVIHLQFE